MNPKLVSILQVPNSPLRTVIHLQLVYVYVAIYLRDSLVLIRHFKLYTVR